MSNQLVTTVNSNIMDMKQNEGLSLPPDYSVGNALNSAYLLLSDTSTQKDHRALLDKCDQGSVIKALMNMSIQGLSPAKNQCYFINYGNQLVMQRSYFGAISVVKRLTNVKDIQAQIVHKDDEFQIGGDNGRLVVKKFEPSFENLDKPIVGAFAWVEDNDGVRTYTVMTKKDIDTSWSHAKTNRVQKEFPEEMAKRTVINRAAKFFINSSSDNDLYVQAVNETTSDEYDDEPKDVTPAKRSLTADIKANQEDVNKPETTSPEVTESVNDGNKEVSSDAESDGSGDGEQTDLFKNLNDIDAN